MIRILSCRHKFLLELHVSSDHPVRRDIMQRWNAQFEQSFANEHYIMLSVAGSSEGARGKLDLAVERTLSVLDGHEPSRLGHGDGEHSELLSLLGRLVNPVNPFPVGRYDERLNRRLSGGPVGINRRSGLIRYETGAGREMFGYVVVSFEWGADSDNELLSRILSVNGELVVVQRLQPVPATTADFRIGKKRDWALMTRNVPTIAEQFDTAVNMLAENAENHQTLVDHEMYVVALGDTEEAAAAVARDVEECFFTIGARPWIDTDTAQVLWFGQFPGVDLMVRDCALMSQNVAEFTTMEATATGLGKTPWGPGAMLTVKTDQGTPYRLNTHVSDANDEVPGDFVVIGNKGGGKTTLTELLVTGAIEAFGDLRAFIFDANKGQLPWTLLTGGHYLSIGAPVPGLPSVQLQPFLLDPTPENRLHNAQLLRMLSGMSDSVSDMQIGLAIENWTNLKGAQRRLDVVIDGSVPVSSELYRQLYRWIDPAQYGHLFAADEEIIPIHNKSVRHFAFDMTPLLADPRLGPVMVFDLLHRIDQLAYKLSCPIFILLEEAAFMLANRMFRDFFLDWIAQKRKRRFVIGIVLQTPDQLDQIDPALSVRVRQLMPSWIVLPNANADLGAYRDWGFTDREKLFIKRRLAATEHMRYPFLLKKDTGESVFLEADNSCLGDLAEVFKSGDLSVKAALEAVRVGSVNPLEAYLLAARRRKKGSSS
jgi:type IV secretory pathway VirB4 component